MRRFLIAFLLASAAATPALAGPDERSRGFHAADERRQATSEARGERRQARSQTSEQTERGDAVELKVRVTDAPAAAEAVGRANRADIEAIRAARQAARNAGTVAQSPSMEGVRRSGPREVQLGPAGLGRRGDSGAGPGSIATQERQRSGEERRSPGPKLVFAPGGGGLRQSDRPLPNVLRNRVPVVTDAPREGSEPPLRLESRRHAKSRWSTNWRRDSRYDWWRWRTRHRSLFNPGFYHDPFGWSYRRHSIGWRLWPAYYSSRYWLDDPWRYRLPYAPPGYRWIRYYDDAVLVDTWDGRVIDVITNFFW